MAGTTVRARVRDGGLELVDKIDLPEGTEVLVTIADFSEAPDAEAFRRSAGGWFGLIDAEQLIADIYASRLVGNREEPKL